MLGRSAARAKADERAESISRESVFIRIARGLLLFVGWFDANDFEGFGGLVVTFEAEFAEDAGGNAIDEIGEAAFGAFFEGFLTCSGFPKIGLESGERSSGVVVGKVFSLGQKPNGFRIARQGHGKGDKFRFEILGVGIVGQRCTGIDLEFTVLLGAVLVADFQRHDFFGLHGFDGDIALGEVFLQDVLHGLDSSFFEVGDGCFLTESFESLLLFVGDQLFFDGPNDLAGELGIVSGLGQDVLEDIQERVFASFGIDILHSIFGRQVLPKGAWLAKSEDLFRAILGRKVSGERVFPQSRRGAEWK